MPLPGHFCWTRFGTEAGEEIEQIVARKERERLENGGIFLWGIGNAIGPSMRHLIQIESRPEVIFSPIRSAPRKEDTHPDATVAWTSGRTLEGYYYELPKASLVTSRRKSGPHAHYALVCASPVSLRLSLEGERISFEKLRNLLTGRPIGASQVTAIVKYFNEYMKLLVKSPHYPVAIRAQLVYPYFVQLLDPVAHTKMA